MAYRDLRNVFFCIVVLSLFLLSCKTSGPGLFGKKSPHDQYSDRLSNAGLRSTALGTSWFKAAEESLSTALTIKVPYKETGYFAAERPTAAGFRFDALRGQKLTITIERKPTTNFTLYVDLWRSEPGKPEPKHIASADTLVYSIQHEVNENSQYLLRVQPELLSSGEYTITIVAGPSLAYPIKAHGKNHIKSFWGADRDGGARKHEGVDMFAARRTPVVAAADGRVTRVSETAIGGKVVWLRVKDRDYTLYYAHLDSQLVTGGQEVRTGDTLGLMGNTGNARTTAPHLHFGIYTFNGPLDPLAFIQPMETIPEPSSTGLVGKLVRSDDGKLFEEPLNRSATYTVEANTLLRIDAALSNWFRVRLPNGKLGFLKSGSVSDIGKPLKNLAVKNGAPLLDRPDSLAAKKSYIPPGESVSILGNFEQYYFVRTAEDTTGWLTKMN